MSSEATSIVTTMPDSSTTLALLVFKLADQHYGLPVVSVVRIIEMVTITPLTGAPEIITGIINLHGKTVPVMDLRPRFNLPPRAYGLHTPIVLVDLISRDYILGLIVDTVEDVTEVFVDNLELTETIVPTELTAQMTSRAAYLAGVAKIDRRLILVLNIQALLAPKVQDQLSQALGMKDE